MFRIKVSGNEAPSNVNMELEGKDFKTVIINILSDLKDKTNSVRREP